MRRSCSRTAASIISSTLFLLDPLALQRIACLLPIRQAACVMHHVGIAVTLQELAEGFTRDAAFVGTVHDDLVLSVERLQRLPRGGEVDGTGNMLRLVRPLCQRHHQAEVFLAVQFLLQLFAIDRFHPTLLLGTSFSSLFDMQGSPLPVSFQSGLYQLYCLCLLYRCVTRCIKGRLSFPNWSLEYALGSGGLDLSLRDRSRAAHEEPDDIDEQGGDGQHAEQQHLREGNPKKRIQRIASRSHESDSQA